MPGGRREQPRVPAGQPGGGEWTASAFPVAGSEVDGLAVKDHVPNMSSIESSLTDYKVLPGIRSVPVSAFEDNGPPSFYSKSEEARTRELAGKIGGSKAIEPLIVVLEQHNRGAGPYVLEGGHRFDALKLMGKHAFPAVVVVDTEAPAARPALAAGVGASPERRAVARDMRGGRVAF